MVIRPYKHAYILYSYILIDSYILNFEKRIHVFKMVYVSHPQTVACRLAVSVALYPARYARSRQCSAALVKTGFDRFCWSVVQGWQRCVGCASFGGFCVQFQCGAGFVASGMAFGGQCGLRACLAVRGCLE